MADDRVLALPLFGRFGLPQAPERVVVDECEHDNVEANLDLSFVLRQGVREVRDEHGVDEWGRKLHHDSTAPQFPVFSEWWLRRMGVLPPLPPWWKRAWKRLIP